MRKIIILLVVPALCSFISKPTQPTAAIPFNDQITYDVDALLFNECTGEFVQFTGKVHESVHGVINGKKYSFFSHTNASQIKGVGQESGTIYRGMQVDNYADNGKTDGSFTLTIPNSFSMITAGKGNNVVLKSLFHITVNSSGEAISEVDNFSIECR